MQVSSFEALYFLFAKKKIWQIRVLTPFFLVVLRLTSGFLFFKLFYSSSSSSFFVCVLHLLVVVLLPKTSVSASVTDDEEERGDLTASTLEVGALPYISLNLAMFAMCWALCTASEQGVGIYIIYLSYFLYNLFF